MSFAKADRFSPAFVKTGNFAISVKAGTTINGTLFTMQTPVTMPGSPVAGEDYRIYEDSGTLYAELLTAAPGDEIGGFHYAPGGNAPDYNTGGDTTPQINPWSIWDRNYRPTCDPCGMTRIGPLPVWADIYLLGVDHHINGTSRNNVAIANGIAKPKRPPIFGGNGTATMNFTWWAANEIMASHGKKLLSYGEFAAAAFGVKEGASRSGYPSEPPYTTGLSTTNVGALNADHKFTSRYGIIQATGCHWVWGRELMYGQFNGNYNTGPSTPPNINAAFYAVTEGRGALIQENSRATRGALLGGKYNLTTESGSRTLDWADALQDTSLSISARGSADHWQT